MAGVMPLVSCTASGFLTWLAGEQTADQVWPRLAKASLAAGLTGLSAWKWQAVGAFTSLATVSVWSYHTLSTEGGKAIFCPSRGLERGSVGERLALTIERILTLSPQLAHPQYVPTLWAADTWTNLGLFIAKQQFDKSSLRNNKFRRELLLMPDGGTVSIDFANDDHLPSTAPFVIFLHTITGSAYETGHFMRYATRRGWRSCVFNRRGHAGVSLTSPRFNVMGDAADTKAQVDFVTKQHPELSYLAMVGISAGSGLLVTYLGKEGERTPVQAACSLCPAYDISRAFRMFENYPAVDRHILGSMKKLFLKPNEEILGSHSLSALLDCSNASSIHEFMCAHFPFTGCDSLLQYFKENNPMEWVDKVVRPVMIVNSEDDVVCLPENIREDLISSLPGALLLRTPRGSHIAYNEGLLGLGCYLSRVTMDFLDSARIVHMEQEGESDVRQDP